MKYEILAWAWLILITGLSLMSAESLSTWTWLDILSVDKWIHMTIYAVMYSLFAMSRRRKGIDHRFDLRVFVLCAFYGLLIECLQNYFGRHFDVLDIIANIIGLLIGLWFVDRFVK
jgi:VanZ family protein